MQTAKTAIRLGGCPGWSESSVGTNVILLVLSWGGSNWEKENLIFSSHNFLLKLLLSKLVRCHLIVLDRRFLKVSVWVQKYLFHLLKAYYQHYEHDMSNACASHDMIFSAERLNPPFFIDMKSLNMIPIKSHVRKGKTLIGLRIHKVLIWAFAVHMRKCWILSYS